MMIDRNEILDRWAREQAAADIARALGLADRKSLKRIQNIIAQARTDGDERAAFRKASKHNDLPKKPKHGDRRGRPPTRAARMRQRDLGEPLPGWHFGVTSIEVPWLGMCSADCRPVSVSVSCVARRPPLTQVVVSKTRRKTDAHKTFRDAFSSDSEL